MIFQCFYFSLENNGVPLTNCYAFFFDNCNTMADDKGSVNALAEESIEGLISKSRQYIFINIYVTSAKNT